VRYIGKKVDFSIFNIPLKFSDYMTKELIMVNNPNLVGLTPYKNTEIPCPDCNKL
jgi:hypothetical protein